MDTPGSGVIAQDTPRAQRPYQTAVDFAVPVSLPYALAGSKGPSIRFTSSVFARGPDDAPYCASRDRLLRASAGDNSNGHGQCSVGISQRHGGCTYTVGTRSRSPAHASYVYGFHQLGDDRSPKRLC